MRKFMLTILVVSLFLGVVGCDKQGDKTPEHPSSQEQTEEELKKEETPKYGYIKNASIVLSKNGLVPLDNIPEQKRIIDWYFDPMCPSCVKLETLMKESVDIMMDKMVIRYHPLGFLNGSSPDNYSQRASAYILSVAENTPYLAKDFLDGVFNPDFFPKDQETPDSKFKELFLSLGGDSTQWDKIEKLQKELLSVVEYETIKIMSSEELVQKTKSGSLYVPLIIIGNSKKALDFAEQKDAESYLLKSIKEYEDTLMSPTK